MTRTTFRTRASGIGRRGAWYFPRAFPALQWQRFIRRLERAQNRWACEREGRNLRAKRHNSFVATLWDGGHDQV